MMLATVNDARGFVDTTFIDCKGHDPRPGLEWDRPVILSGEQVEVLDCDGCAAWVRLPGTELTAIVGAEALTNWIKRHGNQLAYNHLTQRWHWRRK